MADSATNAKFIISTDSCADHLKTYLTKHKVYCIPLRHIIAGKEFAEIYDSVEEFDNFYTTLKTGAMPTTTQLNIFEMQEHFGKILSKHPKGDIIHIPLSSGLSGTCDNAQRAAIELNKTLTDRKIYVVDSLIATGGMGMLIDRLIEFRDAGAETLETVKKIEYVRDRQQAWVIVSDLFHLKRGGRISGLRAAIGTLLNIRPIIILSKDGKLAIETTQKGNRKAINYVLDKVDRLGIQAVPDFFKNPIYLLRTSQSELYEELKRTVIEMYPNAIIREGLVGPIIGAHLGDGVAVALFEGTPRLDR